MKKLTKYFIIGLLMSTFASLATAQGKQKEGVTYDAVITRVKIHGMDFRIVNDDAVEAVVEDPRGIKRA